jgi:asparagine synthase (glutamine-hydrolysing)
MCGISGLIDKQHPDVHHTLQGMLDAIRSRGPDGEGKYFEKSIAMGMRRLSIIDIQGGDQPFYSGAGQIIAFQNGEIYNYLELTSELERLGYKFISQSDTEVLAHGYDAWGGHTLLQKLDGMFAIAILDKRANQLVLARDRFGEKPVYFSIEKTTHRFAYSSDARQLSKLDWVGNQLSASALTRYLTLGFTTGDQSIFESVKKLPPAHYLVLDLNSFTLNLSCYYVPNMDENNEVKGSVKELEDILDDKLQSSVNLRLQADVPVGVYLSGGIDSSVIAAMASKKHKNINTFSMGFSSVGHDESSFAQEVARHIGSNHHRFVFDENSFIDLFPIVVEAADEPIGDQATLPTYWLSREARKHVAVVLSGEGGDEVFGGYDYYRPYLTNKNANSLIFNSATSLSGFPLLMSQQSCRRFMKSPDFDLTEYEENLFNLISVARSDLHKSMTADLLGWLPDDLLVKFDRMSMANSLEGRAPYLSKYIVDFSYGLNDEHWIRNDENKVLLRRVGKRYLPDFIFNRPKKGFVLPMDDWIRAWFKREKPRDYFMSRAFSYFNVERIAAYVDMEIKRKEYNQRLIFSLIFLFEWLSLNQ